MLIVIRSCEEYRCCRVEQIYLVKQQFGTGFTYAGYIFRTAVPDYTCSIQVNSEKIGPEHGCFIAILLLVKLGAHAALSAPKGTVVVCGLMPCEFEGAISCGHCRDTVVYFLKIRKILDGGLQIREIIAWVKIPALCLLPDDQDSVSGLYPFLRNTQKQRWG